MMFPTPVRQGAFRLPRALIAMGACLWMLGCQNPAPVAKSAKGDLPAMNLRPKAPELEGGLAWLNNDRALALHKDLKGHVVLLDFWTYCCINCIHVLPDLKYLEHKYKDKPFMVVGVHSAKFENEGTRQNVRSAIQRYDIEHPVVVDDQMSIWNNYGVNSWPTLVLIDSEGRIVGSAPGEGNREILDKYIAALLEEGKESGTLAKTPVKTKRDGMVRGAGGLAFPGKVLADPAGKRLFIADSNHHRIVVATMPGADGKAKLLATIGSGKAGTEDGSKDKARFFHPQGMAVNGDTLYVADTENHTIREVGLKDYSVRTIAGTGKQAYDREGGGKGTGQGLNSPWDLVVDGETLYIAMAGPHQLWVMDLKSRVVKAFVGSGIENITDGSFGSAALAQPSGLALDKGQLYFADSEVSAVRVADLKREEVRTIIGQGLFEFGDVDGKQGKARLQHPLGVTVWGGQVLVADTYNHKIKLADPVSRTVSSFLGTGKPGGGEGKEVSFYEPGGLTAAGDVLFVADTNNHRIVQVDLNSKEAVEVEIDGLETPEGEDGKDSVVLADPREIDPGKVLTLEANVLIPEGFKLNPEAPSSLKVSKAGVSLKSATQHGLKGPMSLKIPAGVVKNGEETVLDIVFRTAACTKDETLCLPLSLKWQAPVKGKAGAAAEIKLETAAKLTAGI